MIEGAAIAWVEVVAAEATTAGVSGATRAAGAVGHRRRCVGTGTTTTTGAAGVAAGRGRDAHVSCERAGASSASRRATLSVTARSTAAEEATIGRCTIAERLATKTIATATTPTAEAVVACRPNTREAAHRRLATAGGEDTTTTARDAEARCEGGWARRPHPTSVAAMVATAEVDRPRPRILGPAEATTAANETE